jgi:hypothetical protein
LLSAPQEPAKPGDAMSKTALTAPHWKKAGTLERRLLIIGI